MADQTTEAAADVVAKPSLNHVVFWPPFLLLLVAIVIYFVAPEQYQKAIEGLNGLILDNFSGVVYRRGSCFAGAVYCDLFFAVWQSAPWRRRSRAFDEHVELVCDYDLYDDCDRDSVLVFG